MAIITRRPDLEVCPPPPFQGPRSPGLHLSSIISYIERVAFKQKRTAFGDMSEEEMVVWSRRVEMGWMWEKVLDHAHAQRQTEDWPDGRGGCLATIGELECDGIYLTPDRLNVCENRMEEFKATWKSCRGVDEDVEGKLWGYITQLKAACWVVGTCLGRLRIFYVNSDYSRNKDSAPMTPRVYDFEWELSELRENWQLLLNHAPLVAKEQGIIWPPPPITTTTTTVKKKGTRNGN